MGDWVCPNIPEVAYRRQEKVGDYQALSCCVVSIAYCLCLSPLPWSFWFSRSILSSKICCRMAFLHSSLISGPLRRLLPSGTAASCPSTLSPLPDTPPKAMLLPTSRAESALSERQKAKCSMSKWHFSSFYSSMATVHYCTVGSIIVWWL